MDHSLQLPRVAGIIQKGIWEGLHPGGQIYVWHDGQEACQAFGESRLEIAMQSNTLLLWLSATKPTVAIAVAQLVEQGLLDLNRPIAHDLPEFAQHGKELITLRHCLAHTGGFRTGDLVSDQLPWLESIAQICAVHPEPRWEPGAKAGYHASGSWRILGELIHKTTGFMSNDYVRQHIFEPLGMKNSWIGIPLEEQAHLAISPIYQTDRSPPSATSYYNTPEGIAQCNPGSNGRGPAHELGLFYRMLLGGGTLGSTRIVSTETVRTWTSSQRKGMYDHTFKQVVDWGYGFKINSPRNPMQPVRYGFGRYASEHAFGHSGSQCSSAFADPAHNLVVIIILNGRPGEIRHHERSQALHDAVYEDLGLGLHS